MDQTTKDTIVFCFDFVKNNYNEQSQNVQCRNWLAMAIDLVDKSDLSAKDFVIGSLKEIDGYLSGSNSQATSNTVLEKLDLARTLLS